MAHQVGTATDLNDFLNQLRVFAISQSWTIDRFTPVTAFLPAEWLQLHSPNGGHHNLFSQMRNDDRNTVIYPGPYLMMFGANGIDLNSTNFNEQPGSSYKGSNTTTANLTLQEAVACTNDLGGPFVDYQIFSRSNQYIHCVIQTKPGIYSHFGFGIVDKQGNWAGGEYGYGTNWFHSISDDADGASAFDLDNRAFFDNSNSVVVRYESHGYFKMNIDSDDDWARPYQHGGNPNAIQSVMACSVRQHSSECEPFAALMGEANKLDGLAPLDPLVVTYQHRDKFSYICSQIPDVRAVRMDFIEPGETITYGADEYVVFPVKRKTNNKLGANGDEVNSWLNGVAYKKIP